MDIFGIHFVASDLYLLGIVGFLVMLLLGVYIPDAIRRTNTAKIGFRSAFDGVILNLTENPDCSLAQISYAFHQSHLVAIVKYRNFVPFWRRHSFNKAVKNYKIANDISNEYGNVTAIGLSEKTTTAKEKREIYSKSIHRLLSYA